MSNLFMILPHNSNFTNHILSIFIGLIIIFCAGKFEAAKALDVNAANGQINMTPFTSFEFKGSTLFSHSELSKAISNAINKRHPDINLAAIEIIKAIDAHYIKSGYIFSLVTGYASVGKNLVLTITEGSIKEVVLKPELLKIKYMKEYVDRIMANTPFNINKSKKDIALIKRLLGGGAKIVPIVFDIKDIKNGKTVDLFVADYKKVSGIFDINNSNIAFHSDNESETMNAKLVQENGYFSIGSLYTKISNPYNMPGYALSYVSTSGDTKDNSFFIDYIHQINSVGTQLKMGAGISKYKFAKKYRRYFTANFGISHPLILEEQDALELTAKFVGYDAIKKTINYKTEKKTKRAIDLDPLNPANFNHRLAVTKFVMGPEYKFTLLFDTKHFYTMKWHIGRGGQKYINAASLNKNSNSKFNKLEFSGNITLPLPKNFNLNFKINSQYAKKNLPIEEYFSVGGNEGGRGFLASEIAGHKGVSGVLELSHLSYITHPFLYGIREYAYIDRAKVKRTFKKDSADPIIVSNSLKSIGCGLDFHLANDIMVNFELSKPLKLTQTTDDGHFNKKLKLFAGLEYYYSF